MRQCEFNGCIWPVFGSDKNTGIGYCKNHQWTRTDINGPTHMQKMIRKINDAKEKTVAPLSELDLWFDDIADRIIKLYPFCWNCGERIPDKYFRAATAHIFPKSIFDSVKTNPYNYIVVGAGCGCHNETHTLYTFSKMKVWQQAVERFKKFEHLIIEKHKYLDEFKRYAEASFLLTQP